MSYAEGQVLDKSGEIVAYFTYNGTQDVALTRLYDTAEENLDAWSRGAPSECHCGGEPEEVFLWSSYGGGFYWPAKVCLLCHAIITNLRPFEDFDQGWPKDSFPSMGETSEQAS